ncbi:hypothetical protein JL721_7877 [Aureococcus anophagefferens]|nr:hypothetical protein JL721_7877 [Aureococcus anophagefferens]
MASLRVALCVALAPAAALQLPARSPLRRSAVARRAAPSPAPPPAAASAAAGLKRRVAGLGRAAATGRFGRAGAAGPLAASVSISGESKAGRVIPLLSFIGLWYAFNAFFNVQNKLILNQFPYPWVVSWFQLASGLLFVLPMWFTKLRAPPKVDRSLVLKFLPIAALHCGGHGLQVSSMGAGSVFFTHVIKATEPVIGTLVLLAFTGKIAPCSRAPARRGGFLYYGYNEMGFRVLDLLSPVSAAVANSLKRVAILLAAVLFLGEQVSTRKIIGSSVAMGGVLLYSLAKTKASKLPPKPVKIEVAVEEPGSWPRGHRAARPPTPGAAFKPRTTVQTDLREAGAGELGDGDSAGGRRPAPPSHRAASPLSASSKAREPAPGPGASPPPRRAAAPAVRATTWRPPWQKSVSPQTRATGASPQSAASSLAPSPEPGAKARFREATSHSSSRDPATAGSDAHLTNAPRDAKRTSPSTLSTSWLPNTRCTSPPASVARLEVREVRQTIPVAVARSSTSPQETNVAPGAATQASSRSTSPDSRRQLRSASRSPWTSPMATTRSVLVVGGGAVRCFVGRRFCGVYVKAMDASSAAASRRPVMAAAAVRPRRGTSRRALTLRHCKAE